MRFETPNGKTLNLFNSGYGIKARFEGGGELPKELAGTWTDFRFAEIDVLIYLDKLSKKQKRNKPEPE